MDKPLILIEKVDLVFSALEYIYWPQVLTVSYPMKAFFILLVTFFILQPSFPIPVCFADSNWQSIGRTEAMFVPLSSTRRMVKPSMLRHGLPASSSHTMAEAVGTL
jgi:hypothetical protein